MMLTVAYANLAGGLGFTMHNVGDFALGVEQHLGAHHGVLVEGTFVHVHGNPTHATTFGGQAGWRYHGQREESSPFFGVLAGYEQGFAKYDKEEHGGPFWRYGLRHVSVVPHVGYRWNLGKHAAITARFGGGYGDWRITPEGDATQAPDEALGLLRDRLQFTPVKLDSELSVGVRF
jgi:hypothetical protein